MQINLVDIILHSFRQAEFDLNYMLGGVIFPQGNKINVWNHSSDSIKIKDFWFLSGKIETRTPTQSPYSINSVNIDSAIFFY